jgi:hypothetical protein
MMMSNVVVSMVASFINIDNATKIATFQQRKLQQCCDPHLPS